MNQAAAAQRLPAVLKPTSAIGNLSLTITAAMNRRKAAQKTVKPTIPAFRGGLTPGISSGGMNGKAMSAQPTTATQKRGEDFTTSGTRESTIRKPTTRMRLIKTIPAADAYGEA